jgi:hypothetical protein
MPVYARTPTRACMARTCPSLPSGVGDLKRPPHLASLRQDHISIVASSDASALPPREALDMSETQVKIDWLEARIDHQAARIDALYRTLELHGIFPRPVSGSQRDALPEELWEVAGVPCQAARNGSAEPPSPTPRQRHGRVDPAGRR